MKKLYDFVKTNLLSGFGLTVNLAHRYTESMPACTETADKFGISLVYDHSDWFEDVSIRARFGERGIVFSLHVKVPYCNGQLRSLAPENAVMMDLGPLEPDAILGNYHGSSWMTNPEFVKRFDELKFRTQGMLMQVGDLHYHVLPLCGDQFRCELEEGKLRISSDMCGIYEFSGDFLAVSVADDPFRALHNNYLNAYALGGIQVPLVSSRVLPEFFRGFGWCTWDAFYDKVSADQIFAKLDEFRQKGIKLRWLLIDDGWMTYIPGHKLAAFEADPAKFPDGLKAAIDRIKNEYGVEAVGVWHTLNGYWNGIAPGSRLHMQQKENLVTAPNGFIVQAPDEEKSFAFWDAWHGYLADCGVDFVKVDNQGGTPSMIEGLISSTEGCRIAIHAIERSILKHFGGAVINCMSMTMENVLFHPMSALSRNGGDFAPTAVNLFPGAMVQNVYNSVWHNQMYHCDYDMWWTDHETATQQAVLHALSGGPVYVSDEVGRTIAEVLRPVIEDDGTVMLCDQASMPTRDCLYVDCIKEKRMVKVWNRSGDSFALAAFNISDCELREQVAFSAIPGIDSAADYVAYEYFTKQYSKITADTVTELTLPVKGIAVWSIYPVITPRDGGEPYILLGDTEKYVPIASEHKQKVPVRDIL